MARRVATPAATKARALQLAAAHGAAEAARQTGVPAGTIRAWRAREAQASPPSVAVAGDQAQIDALLRRAAETHKAATEAQRAALKAIEAGKTTGVKDLAIGFGVLLDQASKMEVAAERLRGDRVRLAEAEAQQIAEVLRLAFGACAIPFEFVRPLLTGLLRRASAGDVLAADPVEAERAAAAVRQHFTEQLRDQFVGEIAKRITPKPIERLALPAPSGDDRDPEPMTPPMVSVRVVAPDRRPVEAVEAPVARVSLGGKRRSRFS